MGTHNLFGVLRKHQVTDLRARIDAVQKSVI